MGDRSRYAAEALRGDVAAKAAATDVPQTAAGGPTPQPRPPRGHGRSARGFGEDDTATTALAPRNRPPRPPDNAQYADCRAESPHKTLRLEIDLGRRLATGLGERRERTYHALTLPRRHRLHDPYDFGPSASGNRAHNFAAARGQLDHQFTARVGMRATVDQTRRNQSFRHPADR